MIVVMAMIRAKGEQRRSGFVDLDFDGGCGCPILLSLQLNKYFSTPFGTVRRSDSASFVDLTQFNDYYSWTSVFHFSCHAVGITPEASPRFEPSLIKKREQTIPSESKPQPHPKI
jgi:hypothetical protein